MEAKSGTFTIKVLSKQINTKEELNELCKELDASKATIHSVTFTGNSYGFDACARIAQLLESCPHLRVPHLLS